ncbi:uncharacterized protein LOC117646342 [Thrips palmi]|uniref:Uncharacterized protein LOC117646342 n=1 Tax=Thrips palmi TaxID=161013 RepID=A0A6P8Z853_THRPL|nr:uncharacterized protein LOC117646342 [Thrips palmi]
MECNICMEKMNATERRPKCIPCGHTVCLHCLTRISSQICPECRQGFAGPPNSLPDNYFLLGLMEKGQHNRTDAGLWCRDCSKVSSEDCADLGHVLCSVRKLRAEQAAPKLQQLESAVASALKVVQALEEAKGSAEDQLAEWRARLNEAMEAQNELRAAANAGRDVSAALPQGLEKCQQAANLLEAECQLQTHLPKETGTAWNLQPGDGGGLLAPLLLHLYQHGGLDQDLRRKPDAVVERATFSRDERLNVSKFCVNDKVHSWELEQVLRDPNLDKVRNLVGVDCRKKLNWCKVLLQRVAPRVVCLYVAHALRFHLDVIRRMPSLRYLWVHTLNCRTVALDLPQQLEDLHVENVANLHLQSIQRLPNLRKLTLKWATEALNANIPPLPPGHRGLQWLRVVLEPSPTVFSLIKTHAATLQELRLLTASEGESKWCVKDLANKLQKCELVALRRLVLLREYAPNYPSVKIVHSEESCRKQKDTIWDSLLATDARRTVRVVEVLCEVCDKCPAFPALGDFTWQDV